ncbi:MAG: PASTA domain-containing protein [Planctomycetes bacterium]|nr:PASTA domain-containing protein [Planctomycetota bacterium]
MMQETEKSELLKIGSSHRGLFSFLILALVIVAGTSNAFESSLSPHYNAGDGTYTTTTREGQVVWIPNSYLYFRAVGFPTGVQTAYVEITYYDEPVGSTIKLQYDSVSSAYTASGYHTRSTGEGSMAFVKSYHRLDNILFADRQNGGSDFRLNCSNFPIKSVIVRDTPFSDPYAAYALSTNPPWLLPYTGPSRDDVNAGTIKGKLVAGYQGWFRTPNDLHDGGFVHWGVNPDGNSTVDMWPDPADYEPSNLHFVPGFITVGGKPGYLFSSADRAVVQKHFEWMRKYNIDGVYLQRFFTNSSAGAKPEWVLANVREAAHRSGRVWAIEYDISGGTDATIYDKITTDWKWLVDQVHITSDSRYLRENGKPVVVVWGAGIRTDMTQGPLNQLVDFLKSDPVYGGNYVVGCVNSNFPSAWDDHNARYHSIFAWMGSQTNVRDHAAQYGINAQVHVWPGFSWHNLKKLVYPNQYTDRTGGSFFWGKIYNGINIINPEAVFVGMFDEYDEGTAVIPMSDDPPVVPNPSIYGHYITNAGSSKDWWMMLSGYARETLCKQVPLSSTMPTAASLANRSNIGPEMTVELGATNISNLLYWHLNTGDGTTVADVIAGRPCRRATNLYMYFNVDDRILKQISAGLDVSIVVDYYDVSGGIPIGLHYDSVSNQWKTHPKSFTTSGTNQWQTVRFEINDAYFGNRENGADFRLVSNTVYNMNIARVRVILEEGSAYVATVPDVVGQAQTTAQSNITAAGLVVGTVTTAYSNSVPAGIVLSQNPVGGTESIVGVSVDLVVSRDIMCAGLSDLDCDGRVDMSDFSYMAGVWLTNDPKADIAAPAGQVDVQDLLVLIQEWLSDSLIDGAVAYWKLDETTGSVASDYSVNSHHGTLMNMDNSDWVAGKLGNALDFDGVNDYVEITGYKGIAGTASRTCCAWIKTTGSASNMVILDWGANVSGQQWLLGIFSTGKLALFAGGPYIQTNALVTDGQWHHVAAVMTDDGSPSIHEIKLYIDGVPQGVTYSGTNAINTVSGPDVMLGAYEYNGQKSSFFPGLIDDVRIYDRALSAGEIVKLSQ